jgi:hypothetical protein
VGGGWGAAGGGGSGTRGGVLAWGLGCSRLTVDFFVKLLVGGA